MLTRLWRMLPLDGLGVFPRRDSETIRLRKWAASTLWRQRTPGWARWLLILAARTVWIVATPALVRRFTHRQKLSLLCAARLTIHCARSGARPIESYIWSQHFSGMHPLPARAGGLLFSYIGDPVTQQLLRDKHATAEVLERAELPTPRLMALIARGGPLDLTDPMWRRPSHLLIKPRHGSAGLGILRVDVVGERRYRIDGGRQIDSELLQQRLEREAQRDDLLVQEMLAPAPDLQDLAADGWPPVLRLTAVREPQSSASLHSALLVIPVPGQNPRDFINGHLWVPVDTHTGRLARGISFKAPASAFEQLPWNASPVLSRRLPFFEETVDMVSRAMTLLPGLPVVTWDIVPSVRGPVILEGNTAGNWILTSLPSLQGLELKPLAPLLERWVQTTSSS